MRSARSIVFVLIFPLVWSGGCKYFTERDALLLARYGGHYIPSGEGPAHYIAPVEAVLFDSADRALTDDDLKQVFPALAHMDPYRLHIRGHHKISDKSVKLLEQLNALRVLDTSGTEFTVEGLKGLGVTDLEELYISPERFTEEQLRELQKAFPNNIHVSRFRT